MACYSKTTHVFGSGFQARTQVSYVGAPIAP
jgi:hypothetical protein